MIKNNGRTIIYSILFLFCSLLTFAQSQWTNPDGTPIGVDDPPVADPSADTKPNAPIDNHIWLLLVSGLSLGVFIIQTQKKKQANVEYEK